MAGLSPTPTDSFYVGVQGQPREVLAGKLEDLKNKAAKVLVAPTSAPQQEQAREEAPAVSAQLF